MRMLDAGVQPMTSDSELRNLLSNFKQMSFVDQLTLSASLKSETEYDPSLKTRIVRIVRATVAKSNTLKMVDFMTVFSTVCDSDEVPALISEVPDQISAFTEGDNQISEALDRISSSEIRQITDPAPPQKERVVSIEQKPKRRKRVTMEIMLICILFLSVAFYLFLNKPEPQQEPVATPTETEKPGEPERPGAKCKLFVEPNPKDSLVRVLNTSEKFHQGMALDRAVIA